MTITFKRVYIRNYASPYHATIMYAHEMQKLRNKTKARRAKRQLSKLPHKTKLSETSPPLASIAKMGE
jgi:hypothetical protein